MPLTQVKNIVANISSDDVAFTPAGTGAVATTVQSKLRESVSVFDFIPAAQVVYIQANNTASQDAGIVTAGIQDAVTYVYDTGKSLYFPSGTYLMSSTITMGNTSDTAVKFCYFHGDGDSSVIKVTAANVNPFLWQGPNPDVDGTGNRIDGRIVIENLKFLGPSSFGSNTNSIGVKFYGVQGITIRNCLFTGWYDGEHYRNCDIVSRYNVYSQSNYNAVNSSASGYAITGGGQLNSFNTYGGLVANNSNYGIQYVGGIAPCFFGVNFVLNGTSLVLSPNNAGGATVTANPTIHGCYFEGDTSTSIILGGGNGIVRGVSISGGFMIAAAAVPLITVANYSNSLGRGHISINMDTGYIGSSSITQVTSAEKVDVCIYGSTNLNGVVIGDVTQAAASFTSVTCGAVSASGTVSSPAIVGGGVQSNSGVFNSLGVSVTLTVLSTPVNMTAFGLDGQGLAIFRDNTSAGTAVYIIQAGGAVAIQNSITGFVLTASGGGTYPNVQVTSGAVPRTIGYAFLKI